MIKYGIVWFIEELDNFLDHIPSFYIDENGIDISRGYWGCRFGVSLKVMQLADHWNIRLKPSKRCIWCRETYTSNLEDNNETIH